MINKICEITDQSSIVPNNQSTMIPNIIFNLGLTSYELSVYMQLVKWSKKGVYEFGTEFLAKNSGMGLTKCNHALKKLREYNPTIKKHLIQSFKRNNIVNNSQCTNIIFITDITKENDKYYSIFE